MADQCDHRQCPAQAEITVQHDGDGQQLPLRLAFCGHHYREHELPLLAQGFTTLVPAGAA